MSNWIFPGWSNSWQLIHSPSFQTRAISNEACSSRAVTTSSSVIEHPAAPLDLRAFTAPRSGKRLTFGHESRHRYLRRDWCTAPIRSLCRERAG
jgi:hypothetical protein